MGEKGRSELKIRVIDDTRERAKKMRTIDRVSKALRELAWKEKKVGRFLFFNNAKEKEKAKRALIEWIEEHEEYKKLYNRGEKVISNMVLDDKGKLFLVECEISKGREPVVAQYTPVKRKGNRVVTFTPNLLESLEFLQDRVEELEKAIVIMTIEKVVKL